MTNILCKLSGDPAKVPRVLCPLPVSEFTPFEKVVNSPRFISIPVWIAPPFGLLPRLDCSPVWNAPPVWIENSPYY